MLFAIEGIDRAGKTTLTKRLAAILEEMGTECVILHSPNEETKTIESIKTLAEAFKKENNLQKLEDMRNTLHHLFLANKFEVQPRVRDALNRGAVVIYDRYIVSGLAYSLMDGIDMVSAHKGLLLPDITLYLDISPSDAQARDGFGKGFREDKETHKRSHKAMRSVVEELKMGVGCYKNLKHPIESIDANKPFEEVMVKGIETIKTYGVSMG